MEAPQADSCVAFMRREFTGRRDSLRAKLTGDFSVGHSMRSITNTSTPPICRFQLGADLLLDDADNRRRGEIFGQLGDRRD
jgi:hypothetical protein